MIYDAILTAIAVPFFGAALYLGVLTLSSRRCAASGRRGSCLPLTVVVPAHNEEAGITATLRGLEQQDYPRELWRVVVVADNCTDRTAARAAAAGATVWVRSDLRHRGKGYALAFAFDRIGAEGRDEAVVVIDADSRASPSTLSALAAAIDAGAQAVQADYGVSNPADSWRTRLMRIALSLFHTTRSLGRERLGLSCGLRGNGMGFHRTALQHLPFRAFSAVEDVEYGIRLGLAGIRVTYVPEGRVWGEMPTGERASRSQRHRWEGGRRALIGRMGGSFVRQLLHRPSALGLDLLIDLFLPPLSSLALATLAGLVGSIMIASVRAEALWGASAALLAAHLLRGWQVSGTGLRGLVDLIWAPLFAFWKLGLRVQHPWLEVHDWVRTPRSTEEVHP